MLMEYLGSPDYANDRQIAEKEARGGDGFASGFTSAVGRRTAAEAAKAIDSSWSTD